jgi:GTP pyrophosphokinase
VFTPKGSVINLPSEATPIDFAYRIHTDIGNRCIGSKVNGRMVPLDYKLKTGEIVEILTSSIAKGPSIDWLNITKSNQAKSKIRAWFKRVKRDENIIKGRDILEKETKKQGYNFGEIAKGEGTEQLLKRYNMNSLEDIFVAVAVGDIIASTIVMKLKEAFLKGSKQDSLKSIEEQISKTVIKTSEQTNKLKISNHSVVVKGTSNILVRFAKCCNPVPGDEIIGYITKGRGVSIHRQDCKNIETIANDEDQKIVEVTWGQAKGADYITEIQVKAEDREGLLSEIMELIIETKTYLCAVNAKAVRNNMAIVNIKLKISDIEHLKDLMKKIKKLHGVMEIYRTKS